MQLKVGDKIRLLKSEIFIGMLAKITEVRDNTYVFPYRVLLENGKSCPVYAEEVEKVSTKGEQLLLFEL